MVSMGLCLLFSLFLLGRGVSGPRALDGPVLAFSLLFPRKGGGKAHMVSMGLAHPRTAIPTEKKKKHRPIETTGAWHPLPRRNKEKASTGPSTPCNFNPFLRKNNENASTGPSRPCGPDTPFQGRTKNKQAQAHRDHVALPL